mgnify:CR=1 FL=1
MKQGLLIVLEGPDGAGKTTVGKHLATTLRAAGRDCVEVSFPGTQVGTLGRLVYDLHHDRSRLGIANMSALALQTLHVAAHVDALETTIRPAYDRGGIVILDRYWWSTWVYGIAQRIPKKALRALVDYEERVWGALLPDHIFLFARAGVSVALAEEYDRLATQQPARTRRLRNDRSVLDAVETILSTIDPGTVTLSRSVNQLSLALSRAGGCGGVAPHVFTSLAPAKPSVVYDTYWRFAFERQEVFYRRLEGKEPPWTDDEILLRHKFTNAYRASDRVSQYLIRNVIYGHGAAEPREEFFRTLLFKLFNKIETWDYLVGELGEVSLETFSFARFDRVLSRAMSQGRRIYSGAYIMPSGSTVFGYSKKHQTHLKLLERMIEDRVPERLCESRSLREAFSLLREVPTFGDFLAYQYVIDLNYSRMLSFDEMEFIVPGPGARDGIRKCFADFGGLSEADLIRLVTDRQEVEFERLGLPFRNLWGRRLQLIDCQNLFCEVDKYARVRHPEVAGLSGRSRIKQVFEASSDRLSVWYPPKWGLNEIIAARVAAVPGEASTAPMWME